MGKEEYSLRPELEPKRMHYAIQELTKLNIEPHYMDPKMIKFMHKGSEVTHYVYTGWHTGKTIKDGRGIKNLLKQIQ